MLKAQVPPGTIQSINPRVMWLEHRYQEETIVDTARKKNKCCPTFGGGFLFEYVCLVLSLAGLGAQVSYSQQEVTVLSCDMWLKSLDPKVALEIFPPCPPWMLGLRWRSLAFNMGGA